MPRKRPRLFGIIKEPIEVISEKDRLGNHLSCILIHFMFLVTFAIILSPIIAFMFFDTMVIVICFILAFVTFPMTQLVFEYRSELNLRDLIYAIKYLFKSEIMQFILLTFLNTLVFFLIGFQTVIPTNTLIIVTILICLVGFFICWYKKIKRMVFASFVLIPLVINLVLIINFIISFNEEVENYSFSHNNELVFNRSRTKTYNQTSSLITLKNNAYDKCYGIRVFIDADAIKKSNSISYKFKTGIFGFRVLKDYTFYYYNR